MDELNRIKDVMDNELADLSVSYKLKKKTLRKIFKKDTPFYMYFNGKIMKSATLLSTLIIVTSLSLNMFSKNNTTPHEIFKTKSLTEELYDVQDSKVRAINYSLSSIENEVESYEKDK